MLAISSDSSGPATRLSAWPPLAQAWSKDASKFFGDAQNRATLINQVNLLAMHLDCVQGRAVHNFCPSLVGCLLLSAFNDWEGYLRLWRRSSARRDLLSSFSVVQP